MSIILRIKVNIYSKIDQHLFNHKILKLLVELGPSLWKIKSKSKKQKCKSKREGQKAKAKEKCESKRKKQKIKK